MCGDKRERVILILKNMAKRETSKGEETANAVAQVLEELRELRQEVRLAIETATNAPSNAAYRLMDADGLCQAMRISRHTLRRYEKQFKIPARKVGNKKFYFVAEVKNCIVTALRLWKE